MSRRRKAFLIILGLVLLLGLLAAKMVAQVRRGEELFWLAELWAPAAVLSIGLVTCIEFLMTPAPATVPLAPAAPAAPAAKKPRVTRRPAKKTSKK